MKVEDIHNIADEKGILWDNDPVFKMICKQLTKKDHLDNMSSSELELVYKEITSNPAVFSKSSVNFSNDFFIKQNHDYESGDFLDKIRSRLWELYWVR